MTSYGEDSSVIKKVAGRRYLAESAEGQALFLLYRKKTSPVFRCGVQGLSLLLFQLDIVVVFEVIFCNVVFLKDILKGNSFFKVCMLEPCLDQFYEFFIFVIIFIVKHYDIPFLISLVCILAFESFFVIYMIRICI